MKCRDQRRPLPAKRHITSAKIPHHRDSGMRGDLVVVADLQRVRRIALRFMPYGLSMAADSDNVGGLEIFLAHQRQYGIGKQPPQTSVQTPQL